MWDAVGGGTQIQSITLQQAGGAPTNEIQSVTSGSTVNYSYDAAGNVTNDGAHAYTYDAEDRIANADAGSTATYAYDQSNQRYKKTVGSTVTHYVWQASQVIAEHNGSTGASTADYICAGSRIIAKVAGLTTQYFLNDRLSIRLMLNTSGNVIGGQAHLPFGEDFGESGTQDKHHFTSYVRDGEIGADYATNRQYSEGIGRFNRPDPMALSTKRTAPQSWDRYGYAVADPINSIDRLGLFDSPLGPDWDAPCGLLGYIPIEDGWSWAFLGTFPFSSSIECNGPERRPEATPGDKREPDPITPDACNVILPQDSNRQAAIAVLLGEATSEYRLGQNQYKDGDKPNHPKGDAITWDILYAEMVEMVDVIANRARAGSFGGSSWADVASSGGFFGYAVGKAMLEGDHGANGSPECERLRRAVSAVAYVAQSGPTDTTVLYWVAVVQGRGRHRHVRRQGGATRFGDTDFSDTRF